MPTPDIGIPERHSWVWLAEPPTESPEIANWCQQGRPLVVASRQPGDDRETLRLGLARPGKRRFALHTTIEAIGRVAPPLALKTALSVAPGDWQAPLYGLLDHSVLPMAVYGSLAWQYWGQETYLTEKSDLDVLVYPTTGIELSDLTRLLATYDTLFSHPRLDGEIVFPDGDAVAWREWAAGPSQVLCKGHGGASLRDCVALLAAMMKREAA